MATAAQAPRAQVTSPPAKPAIRVDSPVAKTEIGPAAEATPQAAVAEVAREPASDVTPQLVETARAWAAAWAEQRVDDYLAFYAADFRPPRDLRRGEWEKLRRSRILRPRRIEVKLGAIEVELIGDGLAHIRFDQAYRSDSYRDQVRKTLELVREGAGWRILEERTAG